MTELIESVSQELYIIEEKVPGVEAVDEITVIVTEAVQGPPGVSGQLGSDANLRFDQAIAAAEWLIIHNLGKYPSVTVIDSAGDGVEGHVIYDTVNQLRVQFSAAFSGIAYLN